MDSFGLNAVGSFVWSKCLVPTFMLEDKREAFTCGLVKSQVLFVMAILVYLYQDYYALSYLLLGAVWLVGTPVCAHWNVQLWKGYESQRQAYVKAGFSEQYAILCMHHLYMGSTVPSLPTNVTKWRN